MHCLRVWLIVPFTNWSMCGQHQQRIQLFVFVHVNGRQRSLTKNEKKLSSDIFDLLVLLLLLRLLLAISFAWPTNIVPKRKDLTRITRWLSLLFFFWNPRPSRISCTGRYAVYLHTTDVSVANEAATQAQCFHSNAECQTVFRHFPIAQWTFTNLWLIGFYVCLTCRTFRHTKDRPGPLPLQFFGFLFRILFYVSMQAGDSRWIYPVRLIHQLTTCLHI